jgi:predicted enzyme related to lactoylglutathione lyase
MSEIPVKEIGELMDELASKVPHLLREIMATFYSVEAATNMGAAVGAFYKKLLDCGISQEDAMKMTHDYLNTFKDVAKAQGNFETKEEDS